MRRRRAARIAIGAAAPQGECDYVTGEAAADEAAALRARLAAIVEVADDAIVSWTLEGMIADWNPAAERLYGYAAGEAIGRSIALIMPPDRPEELPELLARLRRGERVDRFETVRLHRDGHRLDVSLTVSPVRDAAGKIVG